MHINNVVDTAPMGDDFAPEESNRYLFIPHSGEVGVNGLVLIKKSVITKNYWTAVYIEGDGTTKMELPTAMGDAILRCIGGGEVINCGSDPKVYRKYVMEYMAYGTIGKQKFIVERAFKEAMVYRGIAVYKTDGKEWTPEEYNNVINKAESKEGRMTEATSLRDADRDYIYDNGDAGGLCICGLVKMLTNLKR